MKRSKQPLLDLAAADLDGERADGVAYFLATKRTLHRRWKDEAYCFTPVKKYSFITYVPSALNICKWCFRRETDHTVVAGLFKVPVI